MYKTVLLTQKEIKLLLDILEQNSSNIDSDNSQNIHIIKRHLIGLIPTENNQNI